MTMIPENVEKLFDKEGNLAVDLETKRPVQKAKPVVPPHVVEEQTKSVDLTKYHTGMTILALGGAGLAAATGLLWRKVKSQNESIEALSAYVSRLVNETSCGRMAYDTFVDEDEDGTVNWNDDEFIDEDDLAEKHSK